MRINRYIARATGLSRRESDELVKAGRITINSEPAQLNSKVGEGEVVRKDGERIELKPLEYLLLNKPYGFLSSRKSQGGKPTLYDLLPPQYRHLQVAGRLDFDTSGLVLLTNDGEYANALMHPRYQKVKRYTARLDKPLQKDDLEKISSGLALEDGESKMKLQDNDGEIDIELMEGRNRQIRRTFSALGYEVTMLHRYQFGPYSLDKITPGNYALVERKEI